jgi:hypothetical protein
MKIKNARFPESYRDIETTEPSKRYTITTRSLSDGSEACYVVYYMRQIIATFPVNDPASPDARQYAEQFVRMMDE